MNSEEIRRRRAARDRIQKKKRKRTIQLIRRAVFCAAAVVLVLAVSAGIARLKRNREQQASMDETFQKKVENAPEFEVQLLTPNPYSRPQTAVEEIKGLVIHYGEPRYYGAPEPKLF